jgi:hypothetical protein
VSVLDNALGSIQDALVERGKVSAAAHMIISTITEVHGTFLMSVAGVWNETLMVTFSDNGGQPDLTYGGGNNSPLRGGKVLLEFL